MTKVVKFNIGGKTYQVSRSLALHPQTMLAKCVSEQWQEDPEQEVFIKRDGETFWHVLSCLRDGKIKLPLTTTKEGFIVELEYYGIECTNEADVDDSLIQEQQAMQLQDRVISVYNDLEISATDLENSAKKYDRLEK